MAILLLLWCAFWGAFAAIMGGSTSTAIFIGAASVIAPLLVLLAIAIVAAVVEDRNVRKQRKVFAKRREEARKRAHGGER